MDSTGKINDDDDDDDNDDDDCVDDNRVANSVALAVGSGCDDGSVESAVRCFLFASAFESNCLV